MPKEKEITPLLHSECLCPICREILLEPVTLPCNHTLCSPCFHMTVEKASLCCPFCRRRVSTWARHHARNKTLVNMELWENIKRQYPEECERRANGQETEELEDGYVSYPAPLICKPGEIRQEYEAEISKIERERLAQEEAERKASEDYIQKLLEEEEVEQMRVEAKQREMEEQLKKDEELARILSSDLNESNASSCLISPNGSPSTPKQRAKSSKGQKRKQIQSGDIVKFLSPNPQKEQTAIGFVEHCNSSPLENSMENVHTVEEDDDDMPTLTPQSPLLAPPSREPNSPRAAPILIDYSPVGLSSMTTSSSKPTPKRKCEDISIYSDGVSGYYNSGKKRYRAENHSESSFHAGQLMELEINIYERMLQEEQDRLFALQLQKEMDKELKQVVRKKGSPDEYQLRRKRGTESQEHQESTPKKQDGWNTVPSQAKVQDPQSCGSPDENKKPVPKDKLRSTPVLRNRGVAAADAPSTKEVKVLRPSNKQQTILDLFQRSAGK
ncbi:E3 ubiquitin-protein ligase RNF168 [Discoglossus pictus]